MYQSADGPVDWAEISAFELDLEAQLEGIASDFRRLRYKLTPLRLLPQPKKPDDAGNPRLRQSFHIAVRDQVAWIALLNVVGPTLDAKLPAWVYGHRLYKAAWFEEREGHTHLELGPYRHTTGALYRKFKHSWPLFRRHISLTARMMVGGLDNQTQLDESELSALNYQDKPLYLTEGHWPPSPSGKLYYASIDLEKFYPLIKRAAITDGFRRYLGEYQSSPWLRTLIDRMLDFRVSKAGSVLIDANIVHPATPTGRFEGIPTGLMAAGFISNIAMLRVDRLADREIRKKRRVAQFRFVDDHAILAYSFDELCEWIRRYEKILFKAALGPKIAQEKFDPPELKDVIAGTEDEALLARVYAQAEIDGAYPTKLMTKTLALVSELAGADFDLMPQDSRSQRLRELEWLLLADLPDREIRGDTRAAFAAGRLATLVPIAYSPSTALLQAWRDVGHLKAALKEAPSDEQLRKMKKALATAEEFAEMYERIEGGKYERRLAHYFRMIMQAFSDHPDKPRLLLRVLDYCRATGHPGIGDVLSWLKENRSGKQAPIADYLTPLVLQTLARHAVSAASAVDDQSLLERQRRAATNFLTCLALRPNRAALAESFDALDLQGVAGRATRQAFRVAVAYSAHRARSWEAKALSMRLAELASSVGAPPFLSNSGEWRSVTDRSLGVWVHWIETILYQSRDVAPSDLWLETASLHDPHECYDWNSLRKGPAVFPSEHFPFLRGAGLKKLKMSDSAWLLEHQQSPHHIRLSAVDPRPPLVRRVLRYLDELNGDGRYVNALDWASALRGRKHAHDPRASEWTALQILRLLLERTQEFPRGLRLGVLDDLHPANILIPSELLADSPGGTTGLDRWTWESWRAAVAPGRTKIRVSRNPVFDYRRRESEWEGQDEPDRWPTRLRGCGLLLLGLIARDFRLPAAWNVRGLEGDVAGFVRFRLEETPVSSHSLAIIEAALLPRSVETARMREDPWMFFGDRALLSINDTTTDPPLIANVAGLLRAIDTAQDTLRQGQISVRDHAPRQLIPMNVVQLLHAATDIEQVEIE